MWFQALTNKKKVQKVGVTINYGMKYTFYCTAGLMQLSFIELQM